MTTETDARNTAEIDMAVFHSKDGRGMLCVIDQTGDTKIMWDHSRPDEVTNAKETFDRLRKKGYLAYAVNADGKPGVVVTEFDPRLEKLILQPPVIGG